MQPSLGDGIAHSTMKVGHRTFKGSYYTRKTVCFFTIAVVTLIIVKFFL